MRRNKHNAMPRRGRHRVQGDQQKHSYVDLFVFLVLGSVVIVFVVMAMTFLNPLSRTQSDEHAGSYIRSASVRPVTPPLDFTGFVAGEIISDDEFFNHSSMSEKEIASFITTWNKGCRSGPQATPCLARWTETSPSFPGDDLCPKGFEGHEGDGAASVIWKAAQGCGINPQVLLVMLQKEQGLITASGRVLTPRKYQAAMGYACPDHGHCDERFAGLSRQVYFAARQFRKYQVSPQLFTFSTDTSHNIAFNVDSACGHQPVHIKNQATANLYNYTPYQPNSAVLNGNGDQCSSHGNLNFYAYYKAWFKSDN